MDRTATRVVDAQRQAGVTLRLAAAFTVAAAMAAATGAGTGPWFALHLFLVGGVVSAIAAATQLLAVTWSASPAPPERLVHAQRWCLAGGATAVAVGRELDLAAIAATGAAAVGAGLALVAASLVTIRRTGRNDRFRPAIDAYLVAMAGAAVGVAMGAWLLLADPGVTWVDVRAAHVTLNLFGLVGIVIAGTLPAFTATQARTRMHSRATAARQRTVAGVLAAGILATVAGQLVGPPALTAAGRVAILAGWLGVVALLPRIGRRQLAWAGPRLVQLGAGITWWIAVVAALLPGDLDGRAPSTDLLAALVVGGVAQILVASLAYFGPVIRGGGHQRLAAGFTVTRSWSSVVAANVAAAGLVVGAHRIAAAALAVWALDLAVRAVRLHAPTRTSTTVPTEAP